jgi:multicomponent Na+:H+ antiporter subunit E
MARVASLGLCLAALWILLSGHFEQLLLWLGAASVALTLVLAARMGVVDREGHPVQLIRGGLVYWPWLVKEIVKANLVVAGIVIRPSLPISPTLVRLPASQRSELGQVIYANSITLTPGTVTVDAKDGVLAVHALTREGAADLETGEMDRRVSAMEGSAGGRAGERGTGS